MTSIARLVLAWTVVAAFQLFGDFWLADLALTLRHAALFVVLLGMIDVVMISNLLIMVIVGGYDTFVSRMRLEGHKDEPEWLSHVNASVLKVKLAMALIGISSIHLLKTFINADKIADRVMIFQIAIHIAFLLSAMALAFADRLLDNGRHAKAH